jgi:hypothetical protein
MADTKISDMTDLTTLATGDELPVADASDLTANKSFTLGTLLGFLQGDANQAPNGMPRIKRLGTRKDNSTTTGTEVTDLTMALEAGTYTFEYYIIEQTETITVAPLFGINFDGTASKANWWFAYADLSSTLLAAIGTVAHDTSTATLGFQMAKAEDDFATTTPNMGPSATTNAVQTANTNLLVRISGIIVVTVAGNLELWHSSETATATHLEVGSSLVVNRTG